MVGLEVRPVTGSWPMYRSRVPVSSRSRVMLSSQRLWPSSCSATVAFIVSSSRERPSPGLLQALPQRHRPRGGLVRRLVPQSDHRLGGIVLVADDAEARRAEGEVTARPRLEAEPARGEHAEEVPAREE